jgi:serine/threonine protein kinase
VSPARHHHALPEGYRLHWYEIDSILGQGGFGITYLARDSNLDQLVAIKEFLPSDLAVRTQDSAVHPLSGAHTDTYGWGLNRFLTEARTLAKFRHPNIVRVMSVFEANNTAYMVMEYERGESFENMLKFKQVTGEPALKKILLHLLDGLELVHDAGFIHRDIKPSNVYLREDGVPVLLDFGSARLALGVETRTLTSLVSPGYAPFEQYNATRESDKQGPWTDIYALGATMYRAVTGRGPTDAAARADLLLDEQRDPFQPCAEMQLENYSQEFLHAIDRALAFPPGERPQSVAIWRQLVTAGAVNQQTATVAVNANTTPVEKVDFVLDGGHDAPAPAPATSVDSATRTVPIAELQAASEAAKASGRGWFIATSIVAVAGIAVAAWLSLHPTTPENAPSAQPAAIQPVQTGQAGQSGNQPPVEPIVQSNSAITPEPAKISTPVTPAAKAEAATVEENAPVINGIAATNPAKASTTKATPPPPQPVPTQTAASTPTPVVPVAKAPAVPAPVAQKKTPEKVAKAAPPPAPAKSPSKAPPAPAKTPSKAAPAPKKTTAKKPAKPLTRKEKIVVLLAAGDENLRADRLNKPKKRNALSDYLTVLAIDKSNDHARLGVESIVERYLAKAQKATNARQFDKADSHLRQARFVLDAMKLRKWSQATYDTLFSRYREASRLLTAAR